MSADSSSAFRNITVLIVDDSAIVRARLALMCSELGGIEIVGQSESVPEATSAIRQLKPAVVILDIHLPGGTGLDVLRDIEQGESAPLVIVLTNDAYPAYRKKYLRAGAAFFFDKSTELDQIISVFAQLREG